MNFCPNTSLPEAKALIEKLGLLGFYKEYIKNGYNIPTNGITVDNKEILYQNQTNSTEGIIAAEKTIRDLAARISDRIGMKVVFESDRSKEYKGKIENNVAYVNLAYATLDTVFHEVAGHSIIRALKNQFKGRDFKVGTKATFHGYGEPYRVTITKINSEDSVEVIDENGNKDTHSLYELSDTTNNELYQNLLKELEYGRGKEVLDRIKRDYDIKTSKYQKLEDENDINHIESVDTFKIGNDEYKYEYKEFEGYSGYYPSFTKDGREIKFEEFKQAYNKNIDSLSVKYTLEEQQEEAIVELLGLMTAEKLDAVKDGKLISLLKRLLKEMKQFVRSLINQKEVEIDKLPDNMTLGDLSDLLAYSNSKLILPGYEVEYTTPDNQKFKTYQEASNHISELAKNVKDVDLSDTQLPIRKKVEKANDIPVDKFTDEFDNTIYNRKEGKWFIEDTNRTMLDDDIVTLWNSNLSDNYINKAGVEGFIEKNKEYEQSKEIIEEWKKVNNIQYNPEEIYSRGQEFSSVVGAYSSFDVNLMMQNLLSHIEDNEKAGGKFAISAYTKPVDKQIGHLEGGGGKIKFKLYPQSNDILWAANTDVYSGSVWDASEKVNKDKKSELLGVSYTKYPALHNVNAVQPNLASIVEDLAHHHNELGITLTGNNFRLEYDDNIPYQTKKIIIGINKILDQKYGKLVKPEISREGHNIKVYGDETTGYTYHVFDINDDPITDFETRKEAENYVRINSTVQPTQTNENLKESIKSIENKVLGTWQKQYGGVEFWQNIEDDFKEGIITKDVYEELKQQKNKEYTSQALINTKIAALKEVAKKYPRSLIRSEVKPIFGAFVGNDFYAFDKDELPFQKVPTVEDNTAFSDSKDDEVFNDISDIIQFNNIFNFEDIKINNTEYKDDSNQPLC